jgi:hypothetical protein
MYFGFSYINKAKVSTGIDFIEWHWVSLLLPYVLITKKSNFHQQRFSS